MILNAICVGVRRRNRLFLCLWDRICIFIGTAIFFPGVYIFRSGASSEVVFQNRKRMATSLGCCCR